MTEVKHEKDDPGEGGRRKGAKRERLDLDVISDRSKPHSFSLPPGN